MGYRSDVSLTIEKKDFEKLVNKVRQSANKNVKWMFNYAKKFVSDDCETDCITLYWEQAKWYENFEEVQFFERFYKNLNNYHFVRIGDEDEDICVRSFGNEIGHVAICRRIVVDGHEFDAKVDEM